MTAASQASFQDAGMARFRLGIFRSIMTGAVKSVIGFRMIRIGSAIFSTS